MIVLLWISICYYAIGFGVMLNRVASSRWQLELESVFKDHIFEEMLMHLILLFIFPFIWPWILRVAYDRAKRNMTY